MKYRYQLWLRTGMAAAFLSAVSLCYCLNGWIPMNSRVAWAAATGSSASAATDSDIDRSPQTGEVPEEGQSPQTGEVPEAGIIPDSGEVTGDAGTFEEMKRWLSEYCYTGGTLRLTADIVINEPFDYTSGKTLRLLRPITIEAGEHQLKIRSQVYLAWCNNRLTIHGDGGEEGLILIEPEGELHLSMMKIETESGIAVRQMDGAILELDQTEDYQAVIEGGISYGAPVLIPGRGYDGSSPCAVICISGNNIREILDSELPSVMEADINFRGQMIHGVRPGISWNTEAAAASLESRTRTLIYGSPAGSLDPWLEPLGYSGIRAENSYCPESRYPVCLAVFDDNGAVFLDCTREELRSGSSFWLHARLPSSAENIRLLMWEDDDGAWKEVPSESVDIMKNGTENYAFFVVLSGSGDYCFCIEAEADGRIVYSDVIGTQGMNFVSRSDLEGTRGGGDSLTEVERPESGNDDPARLETESPSGNSSSSGSSGEDSTHSVKRKESGSENSIVIWPTESPELPAGEGPVVLPEESGVLLPEESELFPPEKSERLPSEENKRLTSEESEALPSAERREYSSEESVLLIEKPKIVPPSDPEAVISKDPAAAQSGRAQKLAGLLVTLVILGGSVLLGMRYHRKS